jgi:hypothetical protein
MLANIRQGGKTAHDCCRTLDGKGCTYFAGNTCSSAGLFLEMDRFLINSSRTATDFAVPFAETAGAGSIISTAGILNGFLAVSGLNIGGGNDDEREK